MSYLAIYLLVAWFFICFPSTGDMQSLWRTANNFGIMYSRKRISQNSFPNLINIFPKSFMIFCQELQDPKRNYENQIWTPKAPKDVIIKKKIASWIWTLDPCMWQVLCHWTIKADTKGFHISILVPFRTNKDSFLPFTYWFGRFVPSTGILTSTALWGLPVSGFGSPMSKYLQLLQGSWVRILGVNFDIFSCWHPWRLSSNLVFIVPFGISYVEFWTEVWLVPFGIM